MTHAIILVLNHVDHHARPEGQIFKWMDPTIQVATFFILFRVFYFYFIDEYSFEKLKSQKLQNNKNRPKANKRVGTNKQIF